MEISVGRIVDYRVGYDEFVKLRVERREQQLRAYENQQKEIADIKDFIERFRYKPTKSGSGSEPHKAVGKDCAYRGGRGGQFVAPLKVSALPKKRRFSSNMQRRGKKLWRPFDFLGC